MTRRPDYADTPSPGWRPCPWRPFFWKDLPLLREALQVDITKKMDTLLKEIRKMGAQTSASLAHLADDLHKIADGWAAKDAQIAALTSERDQLKTALESADADKAQAVADAVAADDSVDSAAIDQADAVIHDLVNQADNPPVDGGDTPPADGGDGGQVVPDPAPQGDSGDAPVNPGDGTDAPAA
jgi:hypothetical protein